MTDKQVRRYIQRCAAAAMWRESIAKRHGDDRSQASADSLHAEAAWARTDAKGANELMVTMRADGLDFTKAWGEAREYTFTTYCLHEHEARLHWLQRVRDAD